LSFAYPFARSLPQPLINRQPGFSVLLTIPYQTAGQDTYQTLVHTRRMQIIILGLIVLLGIRELQRSGRERGVIVWFVILGSSPLLAFAVDWGFVELVAGGLLLIIWLRLRNDSGRIPSLADGLLWGLLLSFRLDLFWLPPLWWIGRLCIARPVGSLNLYFARKILLASLLALVVLSPWLIRNAMLTGDPFFTLQAQAELVKDTSSWPGYQVYRRLEPQPVITVLRDDPVPVLRKVARGLKFFWRDSRRFFPPLLLLGFAVAVGITILRIRKNADLQTVNAGGPALAFTTLVLLCIQYSFFDHSLRHLLVILPVLAFEAAHYAGQDWRRALVITVTVFLPWAHLPGWQHAAREAVVAQETQPWLADRDGAAADEIYFFDHSAGPWFHDHPGVWRSPTAEAKIPALLKLEAKPNN